MIRLVRLSKPLGFVLDGADRTVWTGCNSGSFTSARKVIGQFSDNHDVFCVSVDLDGNIMNATCSVGVNRKIANAMGSPRRTAHHSSEPRLGVEASWIVAVPLPLQKCIEAVVNKGSRAGPK